ncbi:copper chaperone taha [Scleroderma citrinum]
MPNYEFNVKMTCSGCSGAVTRSLDKFKAAGEIDSFDVSLEEQLVKVSGKADYDAVLVRIRKTGKEVISGKEIPSEST